MPYHVFCEGREFGIDFDRATAIRIAAEYRLRWPTLRYYARRCASPPIAL